MKKFATLILLIMITFFSFACSPATPESPQSNNPEPSQSDTSYSTPNSDSNLPDSNSDQNTVNVPNIGGLALGDSLERVNSILGSDYEETIQMEEAYYGEPQIIREYLEGLTVIIGKESGKVLQIFCASPEFSTDMGAHVGAGAEAVLKQYRAIYEEPVSRHTNEKLIGWFKVGEDKLVIIDFNKDDQSMLNDPVEPDSQVERIILAYSSFMD